MEVTEFTPIELNERHLLFTSAANEYSFRYENAQFNTLKNL